MNYGCQPNTLQVYVELWVLISTRIQIYVRAVPKYVQRDVDLILGSMRIAASLR